MHYRTLLSRAFLKSLATVFVFSFGFYAFSAFALSDLSKSLNVNTATSAEDTADEALPEIVVSSDEKRAENTEKSSDTDLVVLLDASGSMSENFNGGSKMDAVKIALEQGVVRLGDEHSISLFAAGSTESSQDTEKACADVAHISKSFDGDTKAALGTVSPKGNAPIAFGISEISREFSSAASEGLNHVVLLVVDGADNCEGDIITASEDLLKAHPDTIFYSIGLNVENTVSRDLQQVAENGSGQYFSVDDQDGLTAAVLAVAKKVQSSPLIIDSKKATAVLAGDSFEKARVFSSDDFGKTYILKDHLRADTLQYWKLDLLPGQGAKITIETGESDVSFTEGDAKVTEDAPSAGLIVFDEKEQKIFNVAIQQERNAQKEAEIFSVSSDKEKHTFYLGIGYSLPVHKDMRYTIELVEAYDESTARSDAPNDQSEKLPSLVEGVQVGYLSKSDPADFYSITVGNGQTLSVEALSVDGLSDVQVAFYDTDGNLIDSVVSDVLGGAAIATYNALEDQSVIVGISEVLGKYSLEVSIEGDRIEDDVDPAPIINTNGQDLINIDQATASSGLSDSIVKWILILGISFLLFIIMLASVFFLISRKNKKALPLTSHDLPQSSKSNSASQGEVKDEGEKISTFSQK